MSRGGNISGYVYLPEDMNMLNSVFTISENEKMIAEVKSGVNYSCSLGIGSLFSQDNDVIDSDTDVERLPSYVIDFVELSNKGYDIINYMDYTYLVISMGQLSFGGYKLYTTDLRITKESVYVDIEEVIPNGNNTQALTYPYCIIRFNKEVNDVYIYNQNYHRIDMLEIVHVDKPVIYLYPEEETKVSVKVGNHERFTCTYPKYENGWEVIAKPNGDLIDVKTRRSLYCLYWEGINTGTPREEEGFVVKGEDAAKFLEEKLKILGLNEREANEFIIYWLPQLEKNKYNFIRFQTEEEINKNMPLEVNPKPETVIRVMMEWKGLEVKKKVKQQTLQRKIRKGYTLVEWGGTEKE